MLAEVRVGDFYGCGVCAGELLVLGLLDARAFARCRACGSVNRVEVRCRSLDYGRFAPYARDDKVKECPAS